MIQELSSVDLWPFRPCHRGELWSPYCGAAALYSQLSSCPGSGQPTLKTTNHNQLNNNNNDGNCNDDDDDAGLEIRGCRAPTAPSNWLGAPSKISRAPSWRPRIILTKWSVIGRAPSIYMWCVDIFIISCLFTLSPGWHSRDRKYCRHYCLRLFAQPVVRTLSSAIISLQCCDLGHTTTPIA